MKNLRVLVFFFIFTFYGWFLWGYHNLLDFLLALADYKLADRVARAGYDESPNLETMPPLLLYLPFFPLNFTLFTLNFYNPP